jgi:hypothetical protein
LFFVFVLYIYTYSIIELMYICGLLLSNQYSMSFVWHLGTGDVCKVYSLLDIYRMDSTERMNVIYLLFVLI